MRLVTWNLNSFKARTPRVLELLDQHAPDVLCLQETKTAAADFPHELLAAVGYHAVDHSEGRWNGVAIAVPQDVEVDDVQRGLPHEPAVGECRWIEATVRGVRWVSVYVPNGRSPDHEMFQVKLDFLDAARDRVRELVAAGPLVVAGDWNIAPTDRDVWDPAMFVGATHVTPDERGRLQAILGEGLVDAHVAANGPEASAFTWWDYRMGALRRGMGMRIDLVLASRDLTVRSSAVDGVYRRNNQAGDKPSDHAPLIVHLDR
ncbi:exodeoxyribonuclease III [Nitriliruptoraceae bacterium ZYF776]|nr:exodeoxyribonuclease III [Profundirhabdus halotolerans]